MRRLLVLLVACGGPTAPQGPTALENKATPMAAEATPTECRPRGTVVDAAIGEQAIGATLVFSGSAQEQVAITDEKGQFSLEIDATHNRLNVYYNDRTFEWAFAPSYCSARIRIALDPPNTPQTPIVSY